MPGSYLIDESLRVVFTRGWGEVRDEELIAHARTLRADPRLHPGFRQIGDFTGTTRILLTSAAVREVADQNPFGRDARRGFVVPSDEAFGLLRMLQIHMDADPEHFGIFRALDRAMEWIGLDPATPWPSREPDAIFVAP